AHRSQSTHQPRAVGHTGASRGGLGGADLGYHRGTENRGAQRTQLAGRVRTAQYRTGPAPDRWSMDAGAPGVVNGTVLGCVGTRFWIQPGDPTTTRSWTDSGDRSACDTDLARQTRPVPRSRRA